MRHTSYAVAVSLALGIVVQVAACVPRCLSRDDDVAHAIPAAVSELARAELDCRDAIDVQVSSVPFGGGLVARGCGRAAVYTCTCGETKAVDECHAQCVSPACKLYGCAIESTVTSYSTDKCTWRK